jgi:uncharacterized protein YqhQ
LHGPQETSEFVIAPENQSLVLSSVFTPSHERISQIADTFALCLDGTISLRFDVFIFVLECHFLLNLLSISQDAFTTSLFHSANSLLS